VMTRRNSYLVSKIKKLERICDKVESWERETTPAGYAAGTLDHIQEVVHEALIEIDEIRTKEKLEQEQEEREEKCNAKQPQRPVETVRHPIQIEPQPAVSAVRQPGARKTLSRVIRAAILMVDLYLLVISMGRAI
jgi:hypothetical protein